MPCDDSASKNPSQTARPRARVNMNKPIWPHMRSHTLLHMPKSHTPTVSPAEFALFYCCDLVLPRVSPKSNV